MFKDKIEEMSYTEVLQVTTDSYNKQMPTISIIPYIGLNQLAEYVYPELTALCPMTGLPDTYTVHIILEPKEHLPELKSLKEYFTAYRDLPISHEHLASKIYKEIEETVEPQALTVKLDVAIRGGIKTDITIGGHP